MTKDEGTLQEVVDAFHNLGKASKRFLRTIQSRRVVLQRMIERQKEALARHDRRD